MDTIAKCCPCNTIAAIIVFTLLHQGHVSGQTIPAFRTMDWEVAGCTYDFSGTPGSVVDVTSFGALGDGVTDDYLSVSAAISAFGGSRGTLLFPPGTYLINGSLSLPDSITLLGSGADATILRINAGANNHAISVTGTLSGGFVNITGGFHRNSQQIVVDDATGFAAGDVAMMIQDGDQHMTSSWAMESLGQILVIGSVAGDTLFLAQPIRMDYDSILHPRIRRLQARKAVSIECLKIERIDSTTASTANIGFQYAYNCRLLGVESRFCNFAHADVRVSSNITIRSSFFHEGHGYGSGGKAYGVCVHATSGACLVENNIFRMLRHSMLLQSGANGNVFACNYSTEPYWTDVTLPSNSAGDIVLHGNYPYLNLFEGNICQNIVIDDSHGKNGHHNTFFRNRAELYGIFMNTSPASDSVNFVGNEVTNTGTLMGLYYLNGVNHFQHGNNIKGTITPAGTANLPDTSYYYQHKPSFWNFYGHYPPVGPPAALGAHSIPAKERFLTGAGLATCSDTVMVSSVKESGVAGETFGITGSFFNPHNNSFEVNIMIPGTPAQVHIEIFTITGVRMASGMFFPNSGMNTVTLPCSYRLSPGLYLVHAVNDRVARSRKVMVL